MSIPTQQKAVVVTEIGRPVVLSQRRVPSPKENEVLIKITATHLLPHDAYGRDRGLFVADRLPFVLGSDLAGSIVQLGSPSLPFQVGDHIFGIENLMTAEPDQAGLQEYATLDADAIAKIPAGSTQEEAVTLPINLVTAFLALFSDQFGLDLPVPWQGSASGYDYASRTLVVLAAGSNVGRLAIQLARIAGIGTIIAVASPANQTALLALGATHFFSRHLAPPDLKQQINAAVDGGEDSIRHIIDCYNWTWELAEGLVSRAKPGRIVVMHQIRNPGEIEARNPHVKVVFVRCTNANLQPHAGEFWKRVPGWLETKQILPATYRIIEGLEKVDEINQVLDDYNDAKGGSQAVVLP